MLGDVTSVQFFGCGLEPGKGRYGLQVDGPDTPCAAPTFTSGPGGGPGFAQVTLATTTSGAAIHYTVDRTAPTQASPLYSGRCPSPPGRRFRSSRAAAASSTARRRS